ncbi:MAG: 5'-nucleotidase [Bacteroidaceae bacterium]
MGNKLVRRGYRVMLLSGILLLSGCRIPYEVKSIEGSRVEITSAYDKNQDEAAVSFLAPYKEKVDSVMSPVIGINAINMSASRPESLLSNLMADMLRESAGTLLNKPIDVGMVNVGGLRSGLSKGNITYGNIYEILPFENSLCIVSLTGASLSLLFENIAKANGEGISGARLEISKERELLKATVGDQAIDKEKIYTVATLDYLSEGNDGMIAFLKAKDKVCPEGMTIRQLFLDYVKQQTQLGKSVTSALDGRITVK